MASSEFGCRLQPYAPLEVAVDELVASVGRRSDALILRYRLAGELSKLRIPAPAMPQRADNLWQHTCFEAFIRANREVSYYELNFSPSRQWAVYVFKGYRDRSRCDDEAWEPEITVRCEPRNLELEAAVPLNRLPLISAAASLRIGLSTVVEAGDGQLSYWAIKHPGDRPDFHHSDSFALEFALRVQSA